MTLSKSLTRRNVPSREGFCGYAQLGSLVRAGLAGTIASMAASRQSSSDSRSPGGLPFIDEHSIEVPASPAETWAALLRTFGGSANGLFTAYAKVIGVDPIDSEGPLDEVGSTRTGFRVIGVSAPGVLVLAGKHRFSEYSLEWTISETPGGRSRLGATTKARFPGIHGRAYKALVIDSGAHARITRRMLAAVARRAIRETRD